MQDAGGGATKWVCWTCGWLFSTVSGHCRTCNRRTDGVRWRQGLLPRWACLTCGTPRRDGRLLAPLGEAVETVARWQP